MSSRLSHTPRARDSSHHAHRLIIRDHPLPPVSRLIRAHDIPCTNLPVYDGHGVKMTPGRSCRDSRAEKHTHFATPERPVNARVEVTAMSFCSAGTRQTVIESMGDARCLRLLEIQILDGLQGFALTASRFQRKMAQDFGGYASVRGIIHDSLPCDTSLMPCAMRLHCPQRFEPASPQPRVENLRLRRSHTYKRSAARSSDEMRIRVRLSCG
jgi:hypothetical protein